MVTLQVSGTRARKSRASVVILRSRAQGLSAAVASCASDSRTARDARAATLPQNIERSSSVAWKRASARSCHVPPPISGSTTSRCRSAEGTGARTCGSRPGVTVATQPPLAESVSWNAVFCVTSDSGTTSSTAVASGLRIGGTSGSCWAAAIAAAVGAQ